MHRLEQMMPFAKPLFAMAGAGFCWVADVAASTSDVIPVWVKELGLPVTFCLLSLYAVKALFQVNQALHKEGREAAQKQAQDMLATSREMITETKNQTIQLERLTEHLKSRPCQMHPSQLPRPKPES